MRNSKPCKNRAHARRSNIFSSKYSNIFSSKYLEITYDSSIRGPHLKLNHGNFHVKKECLGLILAVNVFTKTGFFRLDIKPFDVTAAPKKGREIKAGLTGRGPNRLIVLPPFRLAGRVLVGLVKVFALTVIGLSVSKLIGDDIMIPGIQACKTVGNNDRTIQSIRALH